MSTSRFIADTHMGHKNIAKYRQVFESEKHNSLYFLEVLRHVSKKRDDMYYLGDVAFDEYYLDAIKELPGRKFLIIGNHDNEFVSMKKLYETFDELFGLLKYKSFWLSHAPIHPDELRGKKNIHGHVHASSVQDSRYLNVSVDSSLCGYYPVTLDEIKNASSQNIIYDGLTLEESNDLMQTNKLKEIYNKTLLESRKTKVIL